MNQGLFLSYILFFATFSNAETVHITPQQKGAISIQEMLLTGPTQLKMHSLMMIKLGNIQGIVDESYLPGLTVTATHKDPALRSTTAQILGAYFIQDLDNANEKAVELIEQLANDDSSDVRFNAAYHGLSQIKHKTPEIAEQLIDIAAQERNPALQDRIIVSLANYQPQVAEILNKKLKGDNGIAYYEIYEEFTGAVPENAEIFLNMPSTRPHLIIIKPSETNGEIAKAELTELLNDAGIKNPVIEISGQSESYVLMLTTYITRDYKTAKTALAKEDNFSITQDMWLTPELEVQLEAMRKAK